MNILNAFLFDKKTTVITKTLNKTYSLRFQVLNKSLIEFSNHLLCNT
jgi:hypothetical protein